MTLDRKRCFLELPDYGGRGEPQLAVDALAEAPAVRLANPDEIVNLHTGGLILEEAGHDQVIGAAQRDEAIELVQISAEIAEREDEPPSDDEARRNAREHALEVPFTLKVRKRIAHAHCDLDCCRCECGNVADITRDGRDRQAAHSLVQLGEEPMTEVDGQHPEAEARQRDGLEP